MTLFLTGIFEIGFALGEIISAIVTAVAVTAVATGLNYLVGVLTRPKPGEALQREISITTAQEGEPIARIYGLNHAGGHCIERGTVTYRTVSYTHLRAHETPEHLV